MSASIAYVEVRSAVARRLPHRDSARVRRLVARRWQEIADLAVDDELVRSAGDAAERYRLRALDAVHLAAARRLAEGDFVLATWDRELARAAREAGLAVAP